MSWFKKKPKGPWFARPKKKESPSIPFGRDSVTINNKADGEWYVYSKDGSVELKKCRFCGEPYGLTYGYGYGGSSNPIVYFHEECLQKTICDDSKIGSFEYGIAVDVLKLRMEKDKMKKEYMKKERKEANEIKEYFGMCK